MENNTKFTPPTDDQIKSLFTTYSDSFACQGSMEWTAWNSASDATSGNDFEILADHIKLFG